MKLKPLQYRSESPVQGMSDRQQESRGFNPVRKSRKIKQHLALSLHPLAYYLGKPLIFG